MKKRIFNAIFFASITVVLISFAIILGILYHSFNTAQEQQLRGDSLIAAHAIENEGQTFFDGLGNVPFRITWIDANGDVIADSALDAASMESHANREEFREARELGVGESSRVSQTMMTKMRYYARRLTDGSVIRLASSQSTVIAMIVSLFLPMLLILLLASGFSLLLAGRLSQSIEKPLLNLNLDQPLENETYEELSPVLTHIASQQREIAARIMDLKQMREEWETMTDNMSEGIVLLDPSQKILNINRSARQLLRANAQCIGQNILTVSRSLDTQKVLENAAAGRHAEAQTRINEQIYQLSASPILSDGKLSGIVLLFLEITEKALAEQSRREFTANVSHELKTPIHIISGFAELLRNGMVRQEDMPEFFARIYDESRRMAALIEDIIRLSELDEGEEKPAAAVIEVMKTAREVMRDLSREAEAAKVELTLDGEEVSILGSEALLYEIIHNLCENGIKYNHAGGKVSIHTGTIHEEVILSVSDTGIGIPAEHLARIFERFYRVDKSRSKANGGTGLGLSIVKHAAQAQNGTVEVSSQPDEGTCFMVRFPRISQASASACLHLAGDSMNGESCRS